MRSRSEVRNRVEFNSARKQFYNTRPLKSLALDASPEFSGTVGSDEEERSLDPKRSLASDDQERSIHKHRARYFKSLLVCR
jgi:hypothetical protein